MNELLIHNAVEKLMREKKSPNPAEPQTMIQDEVISALRSFCIQQPKIAEAIINSSKTFQECCSEILKDTKNKQYISDIEAYRRAVVFYIPESVIEYTMTVKLPDDSSDIMNISLTDLL